MWGPWRQLLEQRAVLQWRVFGRILLPFKRFLLRVRLRVLQWLLQSHRECLHVIDT